jgi:hypothetical protein
MHDAGLRWAMPTLPELQADFAAAILHEDARAIASQVRPDGLSPAARVQVYGNHVFTSLTDALEATYPVVCRLVDRRFFGFAADRFIRDHPPAGPCLFEYGAAFPGFLRTFPPCAGLPYLPDVARLEWLMNVALYAEDVAAITPAALGEVPPNAIGRLVLRLDPAAAWLRSPWPVDRIWQANQDGADPGASVDLAAGETRLEIRRRGEVVAFRGLATAEFLFRAALGQGSALETAADAALDAEPGFELAAAIRALTDEALVAGFSILPEPSLEGDRR